MKKYVVSSCLVLAVASLGACASTGTALSPRETTSSNTRLSLTLEHSDAVAAREFPARTSIARLPTADRARLSGRLTAGVKLCVSPDGRVASFDLERTSHSDEFDRALAADMIGWAYEPYAGPKNLRVCERLTVQYTAH